MKVGYSNLLGEYVVADQLEYGDCAPLQVVCPSCREPLFIFSHTREDAKIRFLSHYQKDRSFEADCELRVKSSLTTAYSEHSLESREQRLSYFLKCFSKLLPKDPFIAYTKGFEWTQREIARPKSFRNFRSIFHDNALETGMIQAPELSVTIDQYLAEMENFGEIPKTDFSTLVQKRIALDLFGSLFSEPQRPNYSYLFSHGLLVLHTKFKNALGHHGTNEASLLPDVCDALEGVLSGDDECVADALLELRHSEVHPPNVEQTTFAFNFVCIEITYEMLGALARLPYFDLLEEFRANRAQV